MLQNPCKTLGFKKIMVYEIPPGVGGGKPYPASGLISIHHECEGRIEKSVPRITDWHHEACRVMTIGDHEGRIFSIPSSHE